MPLEPKFVDPFVQFPGGKFSMDGFKRVYSNEDTLTKAIPYFWENFEPENYSIWYGEYKYPEDLSLVFMSCNLITGESLCNSFNSFLFRHVPALGQDAQACVRLGLLVRQG
jgi:hypothetical protein